MVSLQVFARRLAIAGGFAMVVAAPTAAVLAAPPDLPARLADCPSGEEGDVYSGTCVPYLVPNSPSTPSPAPADVTVPPGAPCPPGVSGAECTTDTSGDQASPTQAQTPGPAQGQGPEQQLEDVNTPDY